MDEQKLSPPSQDDEEVAKALGFTSAQEAREHEEWLLRTSYQFRALRQMDDPNLSEYARKRLDDLFMDPSVIFLADGGADMLTNTERAVAVIRKVDPEIWATYGCRHYVDAWVECLESGGSDGWYAILESLDDNAEIADLPQVFAQEGGVGCLGMIYKDSTGLFPAKHPMAEDANPSGRERARLRMLMPRFEERFGLEAAERAVYVFSAVKLGQLRGGILLEGEAVIDWDMAVRRFDGLCHTMSVGVPSNADLEKHFRNHISQAILAANVRARSQTGLLAPAGDQAESPGMTP